MKETKIKPMLAVETDLDSIEYPVYCGIKYDGCFTWGTKIWTEKGLIPIGKIVDEKLKIKVASYNEVTKNIEFKNIINWFNNGLKVSDKWFSFGRNMITENHKVFSDGEWVQADNYQGGGLFVNPNLESFITGMLLGDSVASIDKRHGLSWRLSWCNSINDEGYGDAKMEMLKNIFDGRKITKKYRTSGYGKPIVYYVTPSCTNLPYDVSNFYVTNKEDENYGKRKTDLTLDDLSSFNELSLALWFFDDGTISYNNGNKYTPRVMISVPRYSDETHEVFKKLFKKKYNLHPTINRYGKDATMIFSTPESWYLLSMIARVAGSMCGRKIPDVFKLGYCEPLSKFTDNHSVIGNRFSVKNKSFVAYDIEVDGNHNYFANGMLVHNCRMLVIDGVCYSRSLKPIRNKHVQKLFGKKVYDGFDGELVVGDIHAKGVFQKTTSGVMSEDGEPDVKFYVFDNFLLKDLPYSERAEDIKTRLHMFKGDALDATAIYMHTRKQVEEVLNMEAALGGEGIILRKPEAKYKYGRSTKKEAALMKVKFFEQDEFEVVGFEERMHNTNEQTTNELGYAERSSAKDGLVPTNTLGSIILKYGDTTFKVGTGFDDKQRKEIWDNKDKYLGKLASIRYMSVGSKDRPRVPSFLGWRHEDDMS